MIPFKDGNYIVGIWFISSQANMRDWMCAVYKEFGTDFFKMEYRFAYHTEDKPFAEREANWYAFKCPVSEEKVIASADMLQREMVAAGYGDYQDRVLIQSMDAKEQMAKFEARPWVHKRKCTPEEEIEFKAEGPN